MLSIEKIEALERLEQLRASGVLTDEEFVQERAKVLGGAPIVAVPARKSAKRSAGRAKWLLPTLAVALIAGGAGVMLLPANGEPGSPPQPVAVAPAVPAKPVEARPAPAVASEPPARLSWCHMGSCSWRKELDRKAVEKIGEATLYRLTLLGGESNMDETRGEEDVAKVRWNSSPHKVMVLCSRELPTVFIPGQDIQVLPLNPQEGLPNVFTSDFGIYAEVCAPAGAVFGDSADFARQFGYAVSSEAAESLASEVTTEDDLLKRLRGAER